MRLMREGEARSREPQSSISGACTATDRSAGASEARTGTLAVRSALDLELL